MDVLGTPLTSIRVQTNLCCLVFGIGESGLVWGGSCFELHPRGPISFICAQCVFIFSLATQKVRPLSRRTSRNTTSCRPMLPTNVRICRLDSDVRTRRVRSSHVRGDDHRTNRIGRSENQGDEASLLSFFIRQLSLQPRDVRGGIERTRCVSRFLSPSFFVFLPGSRLDLPGHVDLGEAKIEGSPLRDTSPVRQLQITPEAKKQSRQGPMNTYTATKLSS